MFDNLSERLERSFKILKGEGKITEINVAETLKDVRRALLDADVNYKVAKTFTDTVKQKALGQNVLTAVKPSQLMVKIVHDELATLMGGETAELNLQGHPAVILMAGLNGAGKTTLSGKLALMLKTKKRKNPLLAACDVYRPAAIDQLKVLGEQIGIPVYSEPDNKDAVQIAQNAIKEAKARGYDTVIVDTAGRLAVDEQMMQEIAAIKNAIQPDETLFVVDAMTGQDAVNTAKEFNDRLDFDGVVLTKLDGDTRGGAALSIRTVVNKPIKFIGTGEKMEAIDQFHPSRMADRILGMGDIVSLVEKAQEQYDEEEAPVVNNRRDNYSNSRSYQRSEPPMQEQDYGYDSGYDDDYRDPQPQGTTTYGSSSKIINHPAVAARHRTMIYQLDSYEDSKDVIDDLLEGHSVLINLEALDLAGIPLLAADRGEDDPIVVAGGPSVYNPEPYAAFFDALENSDDFTCCVDTGHAGIVGENAGDTIRVLGSRVRALHINDNDFRSDGHLIPFQGKIDWEDTMRALAEVGYSGDFTFEALHLYEGFQEEFYPVCAKYLHDVGRYLIRLIEHAAAG